MAPALTFLSVASATLLIIIATTHVAESQLQNPMQNNPMWIEEQPTQSYTIYNGQVYVHEKKNGWFSWLSYDNLVSPIVQAVTAWIPDVPSFFGGSSSNETELDLVDTQGSQINAQYAYAGGQPMYPNPNGYYKNSVPKYGAEKYPQPAAINLQQSYGNKRPPPPPPPSSSYYPQYPQQQQQPIIPQQQSYNRPPQQPYQQPFYGQSQDPQPQPQQQLYGASSTFSTFGNPNIELVNHIESVGSVESILTKSQERHYQPSSYSGQSIQSGSFPPKNSFDAPQVEGKPYQHQQQQQSAPVYETSTEIVKVVVESSSSVEKDGDEPFPCPTLGQWKWDGQYCIAIGPYPTWGCKPNDLVMSARIAICRNKIFFPNEP